MICTDHKDHIKRFVIKVAYSNYSRYTLCRIHKYGYRLQKIKQTMRFSWGLMVH